MPEIGNDIDGMFLIPEPPPADSVWPFVAAVAMVCATVVYVTRRVTR